MRKSRRPELKPGKFACAFSFRVALSPRIFNPFSMEVDMTNTKGSGPESAYRLGNVSATIWNNSSSTDSGSREFRTVQVEQRYKDGDDWKSSNRFSLDQLLRLRVCIDKAIDHFSQKEMEN